MKVEKKLVDILNMPLFQATISDLLEGLKAGMQESNNEEAQVARNSSGNQRLIYGMSGLASLLGCSISTAQRIKHSGILDSAIVQHGRIIIVDADIALELMKAYGKKVINIRREIEVK